jgi:hypothetical protein
VVPIVDFALLSLQTSILRKKKGVLTASSAKRVRLVVTLTKAGGTLRYVVVSFICVLQENRLRVE